MPRVRMVVHGGVKQLESFLVAMRLWDTPVPIPNTTVKT